jgi:hypothetical protein
MVAGRVAARALAALLAAAALGALLLSGSPDAGAQPAAHIGATDDEESVKPPAFPREAELIEVEIRTLGAARLFVDPHSISIAKDGSIRYTLVIRAATGAASVVHESMRCEARERRMHAVGRIDGSWSEARFPRWESLDRHDPNGVRTLLWREFFCPERIAVKTAREAIDALRAGRHPRVLQPGPGG